jgi:hypothetical protein
MVLMGASRTKKSEDPKGVIRSRILKKDRKYKGKNNEKLFTTQKTNG